MEKRGQLALIIIVAIVIVAAIVIFFVVPKKNVTTEDVPAGIDVQPINVFVTDCIKQTTIDGLFTVGMHAGFYNESYYDSETGVAFYVKSNKTYIPSLSIIQGQISEYIKDNLKDCVANITNSTELSVDVKPITSVSATILNGSISVSLNMPVILANSKTTYTIKKFDASVKTDFAEIYGVATKISSDFVNNGGVNLEYLNNLNKNSNMTFDYASFPSFSLITISDNGGISGEYLYDFSFGLK